MTVLHLDGTAIDWSRPPKPTARVRWSQRTQGGKVVTGSLRTIAHLDHLNILSKARFGVGIVIVQGPYNTGVSASAGTHDYDACWDGYIPGVPWLDQQKFFRTHGSGAYWRKPPSFGNHIHGFTLPPREGASVSDDYQVAGFKVGKYVDGGWSLYGRKVGSSQIQDYYEHKTALAGHAHDPTWFPTNIAATIFDLNVYIEARRPKEPIVGARLANWRILHKDEYWANNRPATVREAARKGIPVDIDIQPMKGGRLAATHWGVLGKDGYRYTKDSVKHGVPASKVGKLVGVHISTLTPEVVKTLRRNDGNRVWMLSEIIEVGGEVGAKIEFEPKATLSEAQITNIRLSCERAYGKTAWKKMVWLKKLTKINGVPVPWRTLLSRARKQGFRTMALRVRYPRLLPSYVLFYRP